MTGHFGTGRVPLCPEVYQGHIFAGRIGTVDTFLYFRTGRNGIWILFHGILLDTGGFFEFGTRQFEISELSNTYFSRELLQFTYLELLERFFKSTSRKEALAVQKMITGRLWILKLSECAIEAAVQSEKCPISAWRPIKLFRLQCLFIAPQNRSLVIDSGGLFCVIAF